MKTTRARNFLTGLVLVGLVAGCASGTSLQLIPEADCPGCHGVDPPAQTITPAQTTAPEPVPVTPLPVIVEG